MFEIYKCFITFFFYFMYDNGLTYVHLKIGYFKRSKIINNLVYRLSDKNIRI